MAQNPRELERVRYWQGQLLASDDLNTQLRVDQRLRWLHNRSLHQPYGIAIGLELERDEITREIKVDDDDNISLICGLAYDCAGRELILQSNRALALPDQFPTTLVITRDDITPDGIALKWKAQTEINPNVEIAITTLTEGLPNPKADPAFRPVVSRPIARPRIGTGQTIPGETTWQPWKIGDIEVGVKVEIDTSAAGFTRIPHYFAEVIPGSPTADFIPAWFASIDNVSTQGFTFQLMLRRITRERFIIADPKGQITQAPSATLTLHKSNLFVASDLVARLLPLVEDASTIRTLANQIATLDKPLIDFADKKFVAFGNRRREATVKDVPQSASFFEVTVTQSSLFAQGDVVVKMNDDLADTRPSRVEAIDNEGTLELAPAITGLVEKDLLGKVRPASTVTNINDGIEITVDDDSLYLENDVVVRLKQFEQSAPAKILEKKGGKVLKLSRIITGLSDTDSLGFARQNTPVEKVDDKSSEVRIEVDTVEPFKARDLVAKNNSDGTFSAPVQVKAVFTSPKKKISLSTPISSLAQNDIVVAADFSVRATVENVSGLDVTVANATLFRKGLYVAKIDEFFKASLPSQVNNATGKTLTLASPIDGLKTGDVIALCTFPSAVNVVAVRNDGAIEVSPPGLLQKGDMIAGPAKTGEKIDLGLITNVTGNVVNLLKPFADLKANDRLSVASVRGAIFASHANGDNKTEVTQPERLRVGDFLADITSWRQVQGTAIVKSTNADKVETDVALDGSLLNDIVGLASIDSERARFFFVVFQIRLEQSLQLFIGDEVLVIGFDRLTGQTHNLSGFVVQFIADTKIITLAFPQAGQFIFRPEDISASILFVRGSSIALIQKHDLFVSWLAVGESDEMPRRCSGTEAKTADCECSQAKE